MNALADDGVRVCVFGSRGQGLRSRVEGSVSPGSTLSQENAPPLGPYRRPMPRVPGGSYAGGRFLMGEVLL